MPIPIAGTGVVFAALTYSLVLGGMLGELIYKTGNLKLTKLPPLTAVNLGHKTADVMITSSVKNHKMYE
jgi:hypothetical protein